MKLLLDQNVSDRIVQRLADLFPDCTHVKTVRLNEADDSIVWGWAKEQGFTIISKDTDFCQRAVVLGHPPKFVWLRVGNCPTSLIINLLKSHHKIIRQFIQSDTESLLVLER